MLGDVHLYVAEMNLHGVLTFSSEIRPAVAGVGSVIITSRFIHNYSLIYAFNGKLAEAYVTFPSLHLPVKRPPYIKPLQYTFVEEVIGGLQRGELKYVYAYPAMPVRVTSRKFFMAAKGTGYAEPVRRGLKVFFPMSTNWISLVPPTKHLTILVSPRELPRTLYVRIGMKRTGLYKVRLKEAAVREKVADLRWSSIPVNLYDTRLFGYDVEDFVKVLETRSKPLGKRGANVVGYVRARGMYRLSVKERRGESYIIPLPKTVGRYLLGEGG